MSVQESAHQTTQNQQNVPMSELGGGLVLNKYPATELTILVNRSSKFANKNGQAQITYMPWENL